MSLQEHLLARLEQDAKTPTLDELLDRAGGREGGERPTHGRYRGSAARPRRAVIVVDASVIVTGLDDDAPDGDRIRERLRGEQLAAPHVIDLEVASAWRKLHAAGNLDERRVDLALADLAALRLERAPHGPLLDRWGAAPRPDRS